VFTGPPLPVPVEGEAADVPTAVPQQDVAGVVLLSAPPTTMPTRNPQPASVVTLVITVAYDANASGTSDLDEGVRGVSVRVVSSDTGDLLTSGFTDERGTLRLQVVTRGEVLVHIPLLGETLTVRPAQGSTTSQPWTVLLPPANQPAVIP
jgi:hypothetical protein